MPRQQCAGKNAQGKPCRAYSLTDSVFCLVHDNRPATIELRRRAAQEAGASQKLTLPVPDDPKAPELLPPVKPLELRRPRDVKRAVARVLGEIRTGTIGLDLGRTLLYGLGVQIQAIRDLETPERLEKLEQAARERGLFQD